MRRKKNNNRSEKVIMITASAFVLTALTMAGIYVREQSKDDGEYRVDLSELDGQEVADKTNEIEEHLNIYQQDMIIADDLDADPDFWEADSPGVKAELTGDSDEKVTANEAGEEDENIVALDAGQQEDILAESETETDSGNIIVANYNFPSTMKLDWPLYGDLIMNYSMDKTVYFETLGQYRYNPALIINAEVGKTVKASANGIVKEIYNSKELGNVVVMDIGDGYELTYGQLTEIAVEQGAVVDAGTVLGRVAEPSAYYSMEGSNLYMKMTKDGSAVNPMDVLP